MSIHALAIHPAQPDLSPASIFPDFLRRIGFLGDQFDLHGSPRYRPGPRFFEHIMFHGSHAVVVLTPTKNGVAESVPHDSREHCQIELVADEKAGFLCGCNIRDPLCPACSSVISGWPEMLGDWFHQNQDWSCSACGHTCPAPDVNWQKLAGTARYWVEIRQVCEGEASPSDEFLRLLRESTSCDWRYFWYHL